MTYYICGTNQHHNHIKHINSSSSTQMEESKVQALHDTLSKLKRSAGLGVSSQYNFGGNLKIKEVNGQIVREDGLPNNPLYHGFVREGTYDPKKSDAAKYGDGREIKRNFDDCKDLVSSSGSEDDVKATRKKLKKEAKKKAKLEAKRQAKLEAKRQAKLEAKRQAKLEAAKAAALVDDVASSKNENKEKNNHIKKKKKKKKKKKLDNNLLDETEPEVKNDTVNDDKQSKRDSEKEESRKRKRKEEKTSKKKRKKKET